MNARTDTQCIYCTHHKVCDKLNRPINIVEAITEFNVVDDNGIDIIVRCMDFESVKPTLKNEAFK